MLTLSVVVFLAGTPPAAAVVTVDTEAELRAAFADPDESRITLGADIDLTDCTLGEATRDSTVDLTIAGAGFTIRQTCPGGDGAPIDRVLASSGTGALFLDGVTITGGRAEDQTGFAGGGVFANGALTVVGSTFEDNSTAGYVGGAVAAPTVTAIDSVFTGNRASIGGAIAGDEVTIRDSTFEGNVGATQGGAVNAQSSATIEGSHFAANTSVRGGALNSAGTVHVSDSTFEGNESTGAQAGRGGALLLQADQVTIERSRFVDNHAAVGGGAVFQAGNGPVSIKESWFDGNTAAGAGTGTVEVLTGPLWVERSTVTGSDGFGLVGGPGPVEVVNATVAGNAGGGVTGDVVALLHATVVANGGAGNVAGGVLVATASILALSDPNCSDLARTDSRGFNWSDDDSCGLDGPTDVQGGDDPGLLPLAANGGTVPTRLPVGTSPLVDAVDVCFDSVPVDQRGVDRPQRDACDIGAVELGDTAPVAADDGYAATEDTALVVPAGDGVLGNDTDAELDALVASLASEPSNGTVALDPDGGFTYEPDPDFAGTDAFTYVASGELASAPATVTVEVAAVNDAPVAGDLAVEMPPGTPVTAALPVTDADHDVDTELDVTLDEPPAHGTVTFGSPVFTYTPEAGFAGVDTFTYRVTDPGQATATGVVTVTVGPLPTTTAPSTMTSLQPVVAPTTTVPPRALPRTGGPAGLVPVGVLLIAAGTATAAPVRRTGGSGRSGPGRGRRR